MKKMINAFPKHPTRTPLREKLDGVLTAYIERFAKKHGLQFEYSVADDPMDVICLSDFYFHIRDIIYDIDNRLPKNTIFKWYWDSLGGKTDYTLHHYAKMEELKRMAAEEAKTIKNQK